MKKLIWISNHPTNYLIYLFNYLHKHFELKVYFLEYISKSHPWNELVEIKFDYYIFKKSPKCFLEIITSANNENSLLVIANWHSISINLLSIYCSLARIKYVIWTDTPNIIKKRNIIKKVIRNSWIKFLSSNASAIMGTGRVAINALESMGIDDKKLINFPFFVDLEKFKPRHKSTQNISDELIFLSSGRLVNSHKGYDIAIEALNIFCNNTGCKTFKYKIAGIGPDRKHIEELIKSYNLQDNVEFAGWLEEEHLLDFYHSGNVLLHPSRFDPFPNCVLEAMACGLTVIGSDAAGSVIDRIVHKENGLIFKEADIDDLASKIIFLYNNRQLIQEFGQNARNKSEEWNIDRSKAIITKIFNKIESF